MAVGKKAKRSVLLGGTKQNRVPGSGAWLAAMTEESAKPGDVTYCHHNIIGAWVDGSQTLVAGSRRRHWSFSSSTGSSRRRWPR